MTHLKIESCRVLSKNQADVKVFLVGVVCTVTIFTVFTVVEQVSQFPLLVLTP